MSWVLPDEAFEWLEPRLRTLGDLTVVELGSGAGTERLLRMVAPGRLLSVEHDTAWLDRFSSNYVYAPIVDGWYDHEVLERTIPGLIGALIVDGPPGAIGRKGLLRHLKIFGAPPMLIDDVHRADELELARHISRTFDWPLHIHHLPNGRAFATMGWSNPRLN